MQRSAEAPAAQKFLGPGSIVGVQRRVGWLAVVQLLFVAAETIGQIDEGLEIQRYVRVALAQRNADGLEALAEGSR